MKAKGNKFTLVELLMVVAIMGILMSLLFPVFSSVMEAGKKTKCLSNFKQIGLALNTYREDSGGWNCPIYLSSGYYWLQGIKNHVGNYALYQCPSQYPPLPFQYDTSIYNSYGMNSYNFPGGPSLPGGALPADDPRKKMFSFWYSVKDVNIKNNMVILAADCGMYTTGGACWVGSGDLFQNPPQRIAPRHKKGFNALHYDGHVDWHVHTSRDVWEIYPGFTK